MASISKLNLDDLIGRKVGSSTLLKEIARGGMGAVFAAYQGTLKRQIAVKILPKSLITPATAQIFQQEAEAAAILSHPNIIPIYEVGDTEEFLFFTMQLVRGQSLSYYIKKARKNVLPSKRTLPLKATLDILICVLDALDYAHKQEIIHRDIKPGNVLMEGHTGRPIIMDFGVAQVSRSSDEASSLIVGTPIYMPPEQILSSEVDGRADIYAAGTMLFEMLIPGPLFPGMHSIQDLLALKLKQKNRLFPKMPSEMNKKVNKEMDKILLKALSYDPDERYATSGEFRDRLKRYKNRNFNQVPY